MRSDKIALDIRDFGWFVAFANTEPSRVAASEQLAQKFVDPLLSDHKAITLDTVALTTEEERIATAYFKLELSDKDPSKGLTKFSYETLIVYALRDATPEKTINREQVYQSILAATPGADKKRTAILIDAGLKRLTGRGIVKHHTSADSFTLAYEHRKKVREQIEKFILNETRIEEEIQKTTTDIATRLGIDFAYDSAVIGRDCLVLLDLYLHKVGRLTALALVGQRQFYVGRQTLADFADTCLKEHRDLFVSPNTISHERFVDFIPAVAEAVLNSPSIVISKRLNSSADAYCLLFSLQQTEDVQKSLNKLIAGTRLLVDTSVVIPCMAEALLPKEERRLSALLTAAVGLGCTLVVGEDVLNEIESHLGRLLVAYRYRQQEESLRGQADHESFFEGALVTAYKQGKVQGAFHGSFQEFIELFMGSENRRDDIIDYLRYELKVEFNEMPSERNEVDQGMVGDLFSDWKKIKPRRPWVDKKAFDTLVWHDSKAFALLLHLRNKSSDMHRYGHKWWWLTQDGSAFSFDRKHGERGTAPVCMSPDFFARYLSLLPKTKSERTVEYSRLPVCIAATSLGIIPPEIRDKVENVIRDMKGQPEYLRRRKLRELIHQAYAARETDVNYYDEEVTANKKIQPTSFVGG